MKFTANNRIDQAGIHYFSYMITRDFGHICRLNHGPDVGIDAQIEIVAPNGDATGAYVAIQIKSTSSVASVDEPVRYIDPEHFEYWKYQKIAVLFAVVNYQQQKIWIKEIRENNLTRLDKSWKISFCEQDLLANCGSDLFQRLARPDPSDPVMRRLRAVAEALSPWDGVQSFVFEEGRNDASEKITKILQELQLLTNFIDIDPIRYGFSLRQDIQILYRRANHLERELSYYESVTTNGM